MNAQELELRALIVAPVGRDGELICHLLKSQSIHCELFRTAEEARIESARGVGVVIMAEEALLPPDLDAWTAEIDAHPSWSELFFILLTAPGQDSRRRMLARQPLGNMVLLERPIRTETLISTVRAALRGRRRQYEMRDHLEAARLAEIALRRSEKLAVASRLALSISHEINNPLAAVTNLLYLIAGASSLDEAKVMVEIADQELARVSEIVTQALRFYRDPGQPVPVRIEEVVTSALALYRARMAAAEIEVEIDFRDCSPIVAMTGELRQVVLHLIGNAVDAIGRCGKLKIRAANARQHCNGSLRGVRLSVGDTGSGISAAVRDTLFEPFVTTKDNTKAGLGLWLSSQIVHNHGGTIQVKSRVRRPMSGTVFSVFLPLTNPIVPEGAHRAPAHPPLERDERFQAPPPSID